MNKTGIEYLDYTWNATSGCTPISEGCENCWANRMSKRVAGMGVKGYDKKNPFRPTFHPHRLNDPIKVKKPSRIGVSFMGDLFHNDIQWPDVDKILKMTFEAPQHTYIILTKRIESA